jgi:hypothetical protein
VSADHAMRVAVGLAMEMVKTSTPHLCTACATILAVSGAGITLMDGRQASPICASNQRVAAVEDIQFATGEGPSRDAYHTKHDVHIPRFDSAAVARWPSFTQFAEQTGFKAAFSYPMSSKGARVGVLSLYQDSEGDLSREQHGDSLAMVEVLAEAVLRWQDAAPPGSLADELGEAAEYRAEIYQASGMVAVQLSIAASAALLRIRAYSFANDTTLAAVAADIVARRLRLTDDREVPR